MTIFRTWLTRMNTIAYHIYTKEDRFIPTAIVEAIFRAIKLFLIINLGFYLVEFMIWGRGFPHIGDAILAIYLAAELGAIIYLFFFYKKQEANV